MLMLYRIINIYVMKSEWVLACFIKQSEIHLGAEVGKVRPAGHMRPTREDYAARRNFC